MNEYSIVIVEFEVEFADAETQLSYDHYVDDRKSSQATINGINKNDIAANTFKIGEKQDLNRRILYGEDFYSIVYWITLLPLVNFILKSLLTIMNLPHVKVIVFRSALEINVD